MSRNKYLVKIAEAVAQKWGIDLPFPPAHVTNRWGKYRQNMQIIGVLESDLEWAKKHNLWGQVKHIEKRIAVRTKRRDRLKLPAPYVSWDHIAAFHNYEWLK